MFPDIDGSVVSNKEEKKKKKKRMMRMKTENRRHYKFQIKFIGLFRQFVSNLCVHVLSTRLTIAIRFSTNVEKIRISYFQKLRYLKDANTKP